MRLGVLMKQLLGVEWLLGKVAIRARSNHKTTLLQVLSVLFERLSPVCFV